MEMITQLRTLNRLFPRATEYAVTREQICQFEMEMAQPERCIHTPFLGGAYKHIPSERLPNGIVATPSTFWFRGVRLTIVEPSK